MHRSMCLSRSLKKSAQDTSSLIDTPSTVLARKSPVYVQGPAKLSDFARAAANAGAQVVFGLLAAWIGYFGAQQI